MASAEKKPRVLLVEDESILGLAFKMALEGCGFDVIKVVGRAEDAVNEAQKSCPDLIGMDIRLKGPMSGIEAVRRIKILHNVSVVYITGNTDQLTKDEAMQTQPFAYIEKPVDDKTLCDIMHEAFKCHQ